MPNNESQKSIIAKIEGLSIALDKPAKFSYSPTYTQQIKDQKPDTKVFLLRHTHDTRGLTEKAMDEHDCFYFTQSVIKLLHDANIKIERRIEAGNPNFMFEVDFSDTELGKKVDMAMQTVSQQIASDTAIFMRRKIALGDGEKPLDSGQATTLITDSINTLHATARQMGIESRVRALTTSQGGRGVGKPEEQD